LHGAITADAAFSFVFGNMRQIVGFILQAEWPLAGIGFWLGDAIRLADAPPTGGGGR
jgi:hypothetical protein